MLLLFLHKLKHIETSAFFFFDRGACDLVKRQKFENVFHSFIVFYPLLDEIVLQFFSNALFLAAHHYSRNENTGQISFNIVQSVQHQLLIFRQLWKWLVMPYELSNAPATFNRLVTQLFRPHRGYARTYFDDIFVHSRAEQGRSAVDNHIDHLRAVLGCMRTNKLYANASKCIYGADEFLF